MMRIPLPRLALCGVILGIGGLLLIGTATALGGQIRTPRSNSTTHLPIIINRAAPGQFPNCRFGAAAPSSGGITTFVGLQPYDLSSLNLGWYLDWNTNPQPQQPYGLEYAQVIRLSQTITPPYYKLDEPATWADLQALVQARPHDLYFVGNEPDSPFQDNMCAPNYAAAYHDVYAFIKGINPAVQVGIGGIVQPTPLRLQYLEDIWDTYAISYGQPLSTDFWNTHAFILNEEQGSWGAGIPRCMAATQGTTVTLQDLDNMSIFTARILAFRQWMADHGQRDKALYITEYGILFPEDILYPEPRVRTFMWNTFNYFLGPQSINPTLGYARDNNHLVQRWMWFSLAHDPYLMGGALFDPTVTPPVIRPLGLDWITGTRGLSPWITDTQGLTLSVNLLPYTPTMSISVPPGPPPVTVTLQLEIVNNGNYTVTNSFLVTLYDANWTPVTSQTTQWVPGCGRFNVVTLLWPNLPAGTHLGHIRVDPDQRVTETNESDNEADVTVVVSPTG